MSDSRISDFAFADTNDNYKTLHCGFCDQPDGEEGRRLFASAIAGKPTSFICNQCVGRLAEVIAGDGDAG